VLTGLSREGEIMANPFQEVVETFSGLKAKFQAGEISRQQFIDEMKKLRLKDDQGRYWMIGAQTGKWYFFDGTDWVQAEPPSQKENKAICVYCGFENKIEAEVCGRCGGNLVEGAEPEDRCPTCGSPLEKPLMTCPRCASKDEGLRSVEFVQLGAAADVKGEIFVLKSIDPVSALLVAGILGLVGGAVYGALAGAAGWLSAFMSHWPAIIRDQQGKLVGALLDGLLGGAAGFILLGLGGAALSLLVDAALSAVGGLKFRLARIWERPERKTDEPEKEKSSRDATGFGFNLND
jgi:hypothetical protein